MVKLIFLLLAAVPAFAADGRYWVWDLTVMPPGFRQPQFTHVGEAQLSSERLQLWVENELGEHKPAQGNIVELLPLYAKFIDTERAIFGHQPTPPSKDRDIHVLIAAIPPYEKNGKKFGFDGFFNAYDQLTEAQAAEQSQHSNERNIVYVNALQPVNSDYMRGVVAHELNHLITHGQYDGEANALDPWLNEMLGEAAMQLTGYFTDNRHVDAYRAHTEWPLAVMQYGISYGGLSLLAEYLMTHYDRALIGHLAPAQGDGFARLASVYGQPWNQLFADYARWLFEQKPGSGFAGAPVMVRQPSGQMQLGPSGVLYLPAGFSPKKLSITSTPKACVQSTNVLRTSVVRRTDLEATALWVQSTPPCAAARGETKFEGFILKSL
ncbi:MAG: hypothetical protein HY074_00550 [Deltaproteobacteria bacterium]|nr:hypothetical protein [Deltaproteobacteria bacterium]